MRNISRYVATQLGIESQQGLAVVEYSMIAGLIALAVLSAISLVDTGLPGVLDYITGHMRGIVS